jgi:hypothetical protein
MMIALLSTRGHARGTVCRDNDNDAGPIVFMVSIIVVGTAGTAVICWRTPDEVRH